MCFSSVIVKYYGPSVSVNQCNFLPIDVDIAEYCILNFSVKLHVMSNLDNGALTAIYKLGI